MKKWIAILLSLAVLVSLPSAAAAEEGNESELRWEDYGPAVEEAFGDEAHFVVIDEVDTKVWIPDSLSRQTLEKEDLEAKAVACFSTADEEFVVYMTYMDVKNMPMEVFQKLLKSEDGTESETAVINDIPCLLFYDKGGDVMVANYFTADGYIFQIMFSPMEDDTFASLAMIILSSVQPNVAEVEAKKTPVNPVGDLVIK
jgi:hypothetical protein